MKILEIKEQKAYFKLNNKCIKPEKLSKDDLLIILENVFENYKTVIFPDESELNLIVNPIEREIVEQIISKIKELHTNVQNINTEINNQFPDLSKLMPQED